VGGSPKACNFTKPDGKGNRKPSKCSDVRKELKAHMHEQIIAFHSKKQVLKLINTDAFRYLASLKYSSATSKLVPSFC
jgi:hypothetical protein